MEPQINPSTPPNQAASPFVTSSTTPNEEIEIELNSFSEIGLHSHSEIGSSSKGEPATKIEPFSLPEAESNAVVVENFKQRRSTLAASQSGLIGHKNLHHLAQTRIYRVAFTLSLTIIPIILTGLWLHVPIQGDNGNVDFILFAWVVHPLYILVGTYGAITLMNFYTPPLKLHITATVCLVGALADVSLLYLYRPYLDSYYQILASTTIIIIISIIVNPVCFAHELILVSRSEKLSMIPIERVTNALKGGKWRNILWKFFCLVALQLLILIPFYWCQVFTFMFFNLVPDIPILNVSLSFLFSASFIPFRLAKSSAVEKLMLLSVFSRNLFTKVSSYPELFGMTVVRLLFDVASRYVLPVSKPFYTVKKKIFHDHDTFESHFMETLCDYYFCTITAFTSLLAYIALIIAVRVTSYNATIYRYGKDEIPEEKYIKLMVLCFSSVVIEYAAFWIVEKINIRIYKVSIIDLGVKLLLDDKTLFVLLMALSVHFLQDAHVALLNYS